MGILGVGLLLFQVQLATASGVVTKPGSAEPLPGATVVLSPATLPQGARVNPLNNPLASRIRFSVSEDDGRFTIRDIEPGEYRLQVQSPLYGAASYGQRRLDGPGTILTLTPSQRLADLKLSIPPTGTIAGRVAGSNGEPLAYATVQAMKYAYQDGKRTLVVVQTTTTDDRGDYRLFWLPSGKYLVVAAALSAPINPGSVTPPFRPGGITLSSDLPFRSPVAILGQTQAAGLLEGTSLVKRAFGDGSVREESWMPTYYPATTNRGQATPVDVVAGSVGSTVTGINITLGPSPVQKIRGRIFGGGIQTRVTLVASGQGTNGRFINASASPIDGSFEFAGVVPGPYAVSAQDQAGLVSTPVAVLVADRDVENLMIAMEPPVRLSARVTLEGVAPGVVDALYGVSGNLRPDFDLVPRAALSQPNALLVTGNMMTWSNVPPGNYQLNIQQIVNRENLKRLHIKSIRLGRDDAFDTIHVVPGTTDTLEIVLTAETGTVDGVARGRSGDPAANVTVVLVPTNARKRTALYKTLVTGNDGKFGFQEIPPGEYMLFAWDDVETRAWEDIEFIRPLEARGRAVRVSEGSKEEVQLNVIYNP